MAPTPPNVNLTAAGAGTGLQAGPGPVPAAPAAPVAPPAPPAPPVHPPGHGAYHFGAHYLPPGAVAPPMPGTVHHRARPQQHADRDAYPDTYPGQYEFNLPPVHRKPPPPVPPYPGTEHLYNT